MNVRRESISFDRIADKYDATRGGLERGRAVAESIAPHLTDDRRVLEVGVGTGAVAVAMADMGRDVVGVDISPEMLHRAHSRLGPRVANGNAQVLPIRDRSVSNAYIVWVLHLVADPTAVAEECARVLRPGGRLVVVAGRPTPRRDDMPDVVEAMLPLDQLRKKRLGPDDPESVQAWAAAAGFDTVVVTTREERFDTSPAEAATPIEQRVFSFLWEIDDETWTNIVEPALERVRALPDQERKRFVVRHQPLLVFSR